MKLEQAAVRSKEEEAERLERRKQERARIEEEMRVKEEALAAVTLLCAIRILVLISSHLFLGAKTWTRRGGKEAEGG